MIETVFALLLIWDHEIKEHRIQPTLSQCLKSKRIAMREINPESVVFSCKKVTALTEIYMGEKKILKIITK